jgi:hypothetical protein
MTGDDEGPGFDSGSEPGADPERAAVLREIAEEVRGESSESEHVAAILYRVSDLYDPDEETTPEDIYVSVRNVMRIKERGTLERDRG